MRPYCPGTAEGEPKRERGESRKAKMAGDSNRVRGTDNQGNSSITLVL